MAKVTIKVVGLSFRPVQAKNEMKLQEDGQNGY